MCVRVSVWQMMKSFSEQDANADMQLDIEEFEAFLEVIVSMHRLCLPRSARPDPDGVCM